MKAAKMGRASLRALALALALVPAPLLAQSAEAIYTEGRVDLKSAAGKLSGLEIGDLVKSGETVATKADGRAELKLTGGPSSIKISPNTVFILTEKVVNGARQAVLQTVSGSVVMKFGKLTTKEPLIGTGTWVGGIRGTEVMVYSGMDGSSLMVVNSGAVELESGGETVNVGANEAVEIRPGLPPGQKYAWLGREKDFSDWNQSRLEDFLLDPGASARKLQAQIAAYRDSMLELLPVLDRAIADFEAAMVELKRLDAAKDPKVDEFRKGTVFSLMDARATTVLNIRFYARSILSMRRFVLGSMYMQVKSRHILDSDNAQLVDFLNVYSQILKDYETNTVPQLVEADI